MDVKSIKSQIKLPLENDESSTLTTSFTSSPESVGRETEVYKSIMTINNRLDELEKENKILHQELSDTRTRENKLLNRFSWLIQIINIGSVILIIMAIILFIDSFYPYVKKLIDNSLGATIVIGCIGTAISGGIIAIWVTFNKYVREVIEREKKQ